MAKKTVKKAAVKKAVKKVAAKKSAPKKAAAAAPAKPGFAGVIHPHPGGCETCTGAFDSTAIDLSGPFPRTVQAIITQPSAKHTWPDGTPVLTFTLSEGKGKKPVKKKAKR
jgi:hypothetical protein